MQIFTIGYEGATQVELMDALRDAGVTLLADVRAVPLSRRPGFSKNVLAAGLREAGIDYVGLKALGTPPEGREAARRGDHATLARVYAGQLEEPEAMLQGAQLKELAEERATALLCFERDPNGCHRSLLIDAVMPERRSRTCSRGCQARVETPREYGKSLWTNRIRTGTRGHGHALTRRARFHGPRSAWVGAGRDRRAERADPRGRGPGAWRADRRTDRLPGQRRWRGPVRAAAVVQATALGNGVVVVGPPKTLSDLHRIEAQVKVTRTSCKATEIWELEALISEVRNNGGNTD